jgi:hypothetical protein
MVPVHSLVCRENDPRYRSHKHSQLRADPKVHAEQSMKIARIALDYYGETKKVHFCKLGYPLVQLNYTITLLVLVD